MARPLNKDRKDAAEPGAGCGRGRGGPGEGRGRGRGRPKKVCAELGARPKCKVQKVEGPDVSMEEGPGSFNDGDGLGPNAPAPVEPVAEVPLHVDPPVEPAIPAAAPDAAPIDIAAAAPGVAHAPDSLPEADASEKRFGCPRCYFSPNGCSTCRRPGYKPRNGTVKKSDPRPLQPKAKAKAKAKAATVKKVTKAPGRHKRPGRAARVSS